MRVERFDHMPTGSDEQRPSTREAISARVRTLAIEAGARPSDHGFGRMFPALQLPGHRIADGPQALNDLTRLAAAMGRTAEAATGRPPRLRSPGDADIPAAYTFLLEFVMNDLVWERRPAEEIAAAGAPDYGPIGALSSLFNRRSGCLDLDSVYDAPRDPAAVRRMLVGEVWRDPFGEPPLPPRKSMRNDLPRHPRSADPGRDRQARMSDTRNDSSLPLSQLHVAYLKAHNALVASGRSFETARRALRQRHQWMVLFDLLPKLADPAVVEEVMAEGPRGWRVERPGALFIPVEFWAAGFALAPSLARPSYDYNRHLLDAEPAALATRATLGPAGPGPETLPANRLIAWEGFLPLEAEAPQRARRIDTILAGAGETAEAVAMRYLLRGYRLALPSGQAAARHLGLKALRDDTLLAALPEGQRTAALPFCEATPLWFYILAEAGDPEGPAGRHLGPLGSRIVAETLWTLARHSDASILAPGEACDFDRFTLSDLVLLAAEQDS
ncbi:hypothetical protein ABLE93_16365 [Xanthobacter sp. KR7-65]|uniref:hypothetical protein n=1 Tax=Xanthobacter sp. KR7-65 TaxID=3156612 RepID=UPI0032B4A8D0